MNYTDCYIVNHFYELYLALGESQTNFRRQVIIVNFYINFPGLIQKLITNERQFSFNVKTKTYQKATKDINR